MFATTSVNLSPHTLLALMEHLRDSGASSDHTDTVRNAWHDISIRMPGEKNWKMAYQHRKELELAAHQTTAPGHPSAALPAASVAALAPAPSVLPPISAPAPLPLAAEPTPTAPPHDGGSVIPKPPIMQRNVESIPGWTEPERRKYRYRLEDVAFN